MLRRASLRRRRRSLPSRRCSSYNLRMLVRMALAVVQERQLSKLEVAVSLYERWMKLKGGSARLGKDHVVVKKVAELKEQIQMLKEFGDG